MVVTFLGNSTTIQELFHRVGDLQEEDIFALVHTGEHG